MCVGVCWCVLVCVGVCWCVLVCVLVVWFEVRPFKCFGLVMIRRYFWEGSFFPQPRAQRSEIFSSCVLCVVCVVCAVCVPNAPPALGWQGNRMVLGCY